LREAEFEQDRAGGEFGDLWLVSALWEMSQLLENGVLNKALHSRLPLLCSSLPVWPLTPNVHTDSHLATDEGTASSSRQVQGQVPRLQRRDPGREGEHGSN
jgi:hypothetical protein